MERFSEAMDIFERKCKHFYATEGTWMRRLPWHSKQLPVEKVYVNLHLEVFDRNGEKMLGKIYGLHAIMGDLTTTGWNDEVIPVLPKAPVDDPDPRTILVIGSSGSGKSTLLLNLAFNWTRRNPNHLSNFKGLVLYSLKELKDDQDLSNVINTKLAFFSPKEHVDEYFLREVRKKLLVLLDGYDEASEKGKRQVRKFLQVDSPFFCSKIVVTTRTTREDDFLKLFMMQVKISDLEYSSAKKIVDMALDGNSDQFEQISTMFENNDIIMRIFTSSPLTLYSLCYAFQTAADRSGFLSNQLELLLEVAKTLLKRKAHNLAIDIDEESILNILRSLRELCSKLLQPETTETTPLSFSSYLEEHKEHRKLLMESGLFPFEEDSD